MVYVLCALAVVKRIVNKQNNAMIVFWSIAVECKSACNWTAKIQYFLKMNVRCTIHREFGRNARLFDSINK